MPPKNWSSWIQNSVFSAAMRMSGMQPIMQLILHKASVDQSKAAVSANALNARLACTDPVIIPVAVHYEGVTNQSMQCLIDLALSQIAVLNADYSSSNSDVTNYCDDVNGSALDANAIAANGACVQFCLADQNHPSGFGLSNGDHAVTINENYVANGSFPNFTNGDLDTVDLSYVDLWMDV